MSQDSRMDYTRRYESPLGGITLSGDGERLVGLWFDGQERSADVPEAPDGEGRLPAFNAAVRWLDVYFSGRDPGFTPPLFMRGTDFQRAVWEAVMTVPYGRTATYGQLADIVAARTGAKRVSARAVGGALARNAICLIIPCHRVVGADGSLTGYAGGVQRKARLLEMEQKLT